MINKKTKKTKIEPLIERINKIELEYGAELCASLMNRLELKINQFFNDFQKKSEDSFKAYWEQELHLKNRFNKRAVNNDSNQDIELEKIPKFIEEFEDKNKK